MYLDPVLFTFYIQDVLKLKKNNSGAKMVNWNYECNKNNIIMRKNYKFYKVAITNKYLTHAWLDNDIFTLSEQLI